MDIENGYTISYLDDINLSSLVNCYRLTSVWRRAVHQQGFGGGVGTDFRSITDDQYHEVLYAVMQV